MNCRVASEHRVGRRVSGFVGVETAVELVSAGDQPAEPTRIATDSRRRDADAVWVELKTADRVDRRFAEDDLA